MNPILLNHFFDIDSWTVAMATGFFNVDREWELKHLSDEFVNVCVQMEAPRGSASQLIPLISRLNGIRFRIETRAGETFVSVTGDLPEADHWVMRAISWARDRKVLQQDRRAALNRAVEDLSSGKVSMVGYGRRKARIERQAEERLARLDRSFRLRP